LQSRGADPSICSEDYEPYLNPGKKIPADMVADDTQTRQALLELEAKYAHVQKVSIPLVEEAALLTIKIHLHFCYLYRHIPQVLTL
jgi:hypothetical protein